MYLNSILNMPEVKKVIFCTEKKITARNSTLQLNLISKSTSANKPFYPGKGSKNVNN